MGRIKYSKVKVELQAIWVLWRNWLARPAVNREVVSSSLTRTGPTKFFIVFACSIDWLQAKIVWKIVCILPWSVGLVMISLSRAE